MPKCRTCGFESLEHRRVLAATADIVFVIDESGSQASGYVPTSPSDPPEGDVLRPWVEEFASQLEDKLTGRGVTDNRYGLITYGVTTGDDDPHEDGTQLARSHFMTGSNVFGTASQFETYIGDSTNFRDDGGDEDAFAGLAVGTVVDGLDIGWDPDDVNETPILTFRNDAAVQFILVADEFRNIEPGDSIGDEDGNGGSLFTKLLDQLRADQIATDGADLLEDAIVTSIAPFFYSETDILGTSGSISEPIFGIDVHMLDSINLDAADDGQVIAGDPDDEFAVFKWNDITDEVEVELKVGDATDSTGDMHLMDDDYQAVYGAFDDPCTEPEAGDCPQYDEPDNEHWEALLDMEDQFVDQSNFHVEDYAFLTWESRGTAWDFEVLRDNYDTVNNEFDEPFDDSDGVNTQIEAFTAAVVDDSFEKIRLQIADFNGDGTITLEDDFNAFWSTALSEKQNPTTTDARILDLDGDGNVIESGAIDPEDIDVLLDLFLTVEGDSNFDYEYDSSDFVKVFRNGEFEDTPDDNSSWGEGDWNGDFDYDSSDFVTAFQAGHYENDEIDVDGDGIADYLPIWALDAALNGSEDFYRPDWS